MDMNEIDNIIASLRGHLELLQADGIMHIPVKEKKKEHVMQKEKTSKGKQNKREALVELKQKTDSCTKCKALVNVRNTVVFGAGNAQSKLMFVGEAPGMEEDKQGLPFVGRAGKLLTKMIESIGLTREKVFIANVLKCRPPQNRNPLPEEIMNCEPYLMSQIEIIKPKVICALGTFAARTLLKSDNTISRLRGEFHDYHGVKLIPTFHPAYLLRSPSEKRKAWEDMKMIKKELGI